MPRGARLAVEIEAESGPLRKGLNRAARDVERFGESSGKNFQQFARSAERAARKAERDLERFRKRAVRDFKQLGRSLSTAAAGIAAGFGALAVTQARFAAEVERTAAGTGQSIQSVQAYGAALKALGRDQEDVNDLFIDFGDRLQELRDGTTSFTADFALLGLEARDFADLSLDEGIRKFSEAVRESSDQTKALAAAARIFPQFQGIIGQLGPTVDDLGDRLRRTGGVLSGSAANFAELSKSLTVATSTLRAQFLRGLEDAVGTGREFDGAIRSIGVAVREITAGFARGIQFVVEYREVIFTAAAAIGALIVAAKAFAAGAILVNAFKAINLAALPLTIKIVAIVAAVAAIGVVGVQIVRQWEHVRGFFAGIVESLIARFKQLGVGIRLVFQRAIAAVFGLISDLVDSFRGAINTFIAAANVFGADLEPLEFKFDDTAAKQAVLDLEAEYVNLGNAAAASFDSATGALRTGIRNGIDETVAFVKDIPGRVIGALRTDAPTPQQAAVTAQATVATRMYEDGLTSLVKGVQGASRANQGLEGAIRVVRERYAELGGSVAERAQALIDEKRALEQVRNLSVDARLALQALAVGTKTVEEALMGLTAAEARTVVDLSGVGAMEGIPEAATNAANAVSLGFVDALRGSLQEAVQSGNWSGVGDSLFDSLRTTLAGGFVDRFSNWLNDALSQLLGGGGFGGFGLGNLFGGSFQNGGIVPGNRGEAVLIRAHAGERVVPEGQGLLTVNVPLSITGNIDQATRRNVVQMSRELQAGAFDIARERGVV